MGILEEAKQLQEDMIKHRRFLHENPEVHLDLPITYAYVIEQLIKMGFEPQTLGSSGIVAVIGKDTGKTLLLRADMDALPIQEEVDLAFKSKNSNMHACGHDLHTAILLGAAQILKNHEQDLEGQVKLMFQPAEETLSGAKMMIEEGVLENPAVDAAMMMHVISGMPLPVGTVVFSGDISTYAAADWFEINIQGKGCHGAMPHSGVDPLNIMTKIFDALQSINAREISPSDTVVITIGEMHGGNISNAMADTAVMRGTIRTTDNEVREFVKQRVEELATSIAIAFRGSATVTFSRGVPPMRPNLALDDQMRGYASEVLGKELILETKVLASQQSNASKGMGSEDFALISQHIPSIALAIAAGKADEGYTFPMHHPKVMFDESVMPYGATVFAHCAIEWLKEN